MFELMQDLRSMGESNAVLTRNDEEPSLKRDIMIAASIYKGNVNFFLNFILIKKIIVFFFYFYSKELHGNPDGSIPATFQVIIS